MRNATLITIVGAMLLAGCASAPTPTNQLVETQVALRAAHDSSANNVPQAQLHTKLAEEQLERAQKLIGDGENEQAASLLARAKADAELALALSRKAEAEHAAGQDSMNAHPRTNMRTQ